MKKLITLFLLLLVASCSTEEPAKTKPQTSPAQQEQNNHPHPHPPFQSITPSQAVKLMAKEANLLILDTRTTREIVQYGAIKNAVQADIRAIANNGLPNPKDQPILVVCAVGGRSYAVGRFLAKKGHTEIYNLSGGLDRWAREGRPVVYPK